MHEILIELSAERDLRRLPQDLFKRIIPHIKKLKDNPRPDGCRKISGSENDWRIRIGDYRVIYEIDDKGKVVRIIKVRHRKESYK